jgi:hypothetical protein
MLDLPDRSVLVMGLDHWDQRSGAFRLIEEPRLSRLLRLRLQDDSRLATTGDPQLRKIRAAVFPRWFVCDTIPAAQTIILHGPPHEGAQKHPCRYPTPKAAHCLLARHASSILASPILVAFASARPIFSWLAQLGPGRAGATLPMSRRRPPK